MFHPVEIEPGSNKGVLTPSTIISNGVPPGKYLIFDIVSTFRTVVKLKGNKFDTPINYGALNCICGKLASRVN